MSDAISEFETGRRGGPDTYGDAGCRLVGLGAFAMVLRHHRYDWKCNDSVHLFARDPELGAQVFIEIFPGGADERDWREELRSYEEQRSDFRLPRGLRFDASFLAPAAIGFARHIALRTRDGRTASASYTPSRAGNETFFSSIRATTTSFTAAAFSTRCGLA